MQQVSTKMKPLPLEYQKGAAFSVSNLGTLFFLLFFLQRRELQKGHDLLLALGGELVIAHDQIGLGRALGELRGVLAQELADGDAQVLGEELDFFDGRDLPPAFDVIYEAVPYSTFSASDSRLYTFGGTVFFDIVHKNSFVQVLSLLLNKE